MADSSKNTPVKKASASHPELLGLSTTEARLLLLSSVCVYEDGKPDMEKVAEFSNSIGGGLSVASAKTMASRGRRKLLKSIEDGAFGNATDEEEAEPVEAKAPAKPKVPKAKTTVKVKLNAPAKAPAKTKAPAKANAPAKSKAPTPAKRGRKRKASPSPTPETESDDGESSFVAMVLEDGAVEPQPMDEEEKGGDIQVEV
ncbi:histone h1.3 [Penicillium lividum]|nr:histone h1.3 [Penicillium lividum]